MSEKRSLDDKIPGKVTQSGSVGDRQERIKEDGQDVENATTTTGVIAKGRVENVKPTGYRRKPDSEDVRGSIQPTKAAVAATGDPPGATKYPGGRTARSANTANSCGNSTPGSSGVPGSALRVGAVAVPGIAAASAGAFDLEMGDSQTVISRQETVVAQAISADVLTNELRAQLRSELRGEFQAEMQGEIVHAEAVGTGALAAGDGGGTEPTPPADASKVDASAGKVGCWTRNRKLMALGIALLLIGVGAAVGAILASGSSGGGDGQPDPNNPVAPPTDASTPAPSQAPDVPPPIPFSIRDEITGGSGDDRFGSAVYLSASGNTLAVGAVVNQGYVEIYRWNGSRYTKLGQTIRGTGGGDQFGRCVSLSDDGNTLAVGAWNNDPSGKSDAGHARMYRYDGSLWNQLGQTLNGDKAGDNFGWYTSLSGNGEILAVSSRLGDPTSSLVDAGYVRVYELSGSRWSQLGSDLAGENTEAQFGRSISLSTDGNRLAVGVNFGADGKGRVRAFQFDGSNWSRLGQALDGEQQDDWQGTSVKLVGDGSMLAIGADGYDRTSGLVRVYSLNGGTWTQRGQSLYGEGPGDQFGASFISMDSSGTYLGVAAPRHDNNRGKAYVFVYFNSQWFKVFEVLGRNTEDKLGRVALSANGEAFVVGAPQSDTAGNPAGYVTCYSIAGF